MSKDPIQEITGSLNTVLEHLRKAQRYWAQDQLRMLREAADALNTLAAILRQEIDNRSRQMHIPGTEPTNNLTGPNPPQ